MGKKATKAADNVYCIARYKAAEDNSGFESREKASEIIGIDRTRLARIELGTILPYPEEVLLLAEAYHAPELYNTYCVGQCPIGQKTMQAIEVEDFDRIALKALGALRNADMIRNKLIKIAEDGQVDDDEHEDFAEVLNELRKISLNAQALQLWADKHIEAMSTQSK